MIGDLFRANNTDIQETVSSVYYMMKQRVGDLDFRQEIRAKLGKSEQSQRDFETQISRLKQKNEQLEK